MAVDQRRYPAARAPDAGNNYLWRFCRAQIAIHTGIAAKLVSPAGGAAFSEPGRDAFRGMAAAARSGLSAITGDVADAPAVRRVSGWPSRAYWPIAARRRHFAPRHFALQVSPGAGAVVGVQDRGRRSVERRPATSRRCAAGQRQRRLNTVRVIQASPCCLATAVLGWLLKRSRFPARDQRSAGVRASAVLQQKLVKFRDPS